MTTGRHPRQAPRAAKLALCVVVALAVLVSPWESGLLPAPVQDLGGAHAAAQTPPPVPVVSGTPDPCPTSPAPWTPQLTDPGYLTSSECVLELPACPQSPLNPPGTAIFMRLSAPPAGLAAQFPSLPIDYPDVPSLRSYPDFCEERVLDSDPEHATCLGMTGYVVSQYVDGGQNGCRLLHPIKCPAGLYMGTSSTCRAVERRTWVCPADHVPRNEFNTCYRLQTAAPNPHPACGPGSPDFVAMSCEDYVGSDFIADPAAVDCAATYVTGTPAEYPAGTVALAGAPPVQMQPNYRAGISSGHWCSYDARFLDTNCHRTNLSPPPAKCMTASMALCIKRASQTGGCDAVAETIRCRAYEAAYRQGGAVPLDEVRLKGCTPCVILPFRRVPRRCPPDTREQPRPGRSSGLRNHYTVDPDLVAIHREEADFAINAPKCAPVRHQGESLQDHSDCAVLAVCADPPRGAVAWEPTHVSGVAVVNAPVIVTVTDIRLHESIWAGHYYFSSRIPDTPIIWFTRSRYQVTYDGDSGDDPRVRTFEGIDPTATFGSVDEITGGSLVDPGGECEVGEAPRFKLVVQELWPDNGPTVYQPDCSVLPADQRPGSDAEAIIELFGPDSLDWWCELSDDERRRRTAARGLGWWDDATTDQAQRVEELTEKVDCDYTTSAETIWCRWRPTRPGYYRLIAAGAWYLRRHYNRTPAWGWLTAMLDYLNDPTDGARRRQRMSQQLTGVGRVPADIGLSDDLTTALPPPYLTPDWIYGDAALVNCPSIDLRVYCNSDSSGNYTESEPVGVMVHELRVSTVTPTR